MTFFLFNYENIQQLWCFFYSWNMEEFDSDNNISSFILQDSLETGERWRPVPPAACAADGLLMFTLCGWDLGERMPLFLQRVGRGAAGMQMRWESAKWGRFYADCFKMLHRPCYSIADKVLPYLYSIVSLFLHTFPFLFGLAEVILAVWTAALLLLSIQPWLSFFIALHVD